MGYRQSVGRRFIDLRPDAPIPDYPTEIERRRHVRRVGDRPPPDNRKGRRVSLLFCARWSCAWCGRELECRRNIPYGKRRFVVVEHLSPFPCECHESRLTGTSVVLSWTFQGGIEA